MKKRVFVFCHGFGFDPSYWVPLRSYFVDQSVICIDLGYFNAEYQDLADDPNVEWVGIGHSFGLIKLLHLGLPFHALIGLHGFVDFLGGKSLLRASRMREWQLFIRQATRSLPQMLFHFYERAGVVFSIPKAGRIQPLRLMEDLHLLGCSVPIPSGVPLLILGSNDDVIVPMALLEDNFADCCSVTLECIDHAKHGLGHLYPKRVHERILRFLDDL